MLFDLDTKLDLRSLFGGHATLGSLLTKVEEDDMYMLKHCVIVAEYIEKMLQVLGAYEKIFKQKRVLNPEEVISLRKKLLAQTLRLKKIMIKSTTILSASAQNCVVFLQQAQAVQTPPIFEKVLGERITLLKQIMNTCSELGTIFDALEQFLDNGLRDGSADQTLSQIRQQLVRVLQDEIRIYTIENKMFFTDQQSLEAQVALYLKKSLNVASADKRRARLLSRLGKVIFLTVASAQILITTSTTYLLTHPAPFSNTTKQYFIAEQKALAPSTQDITFSARDKVNLHGKLFTNPDADSTKVVVILHEYSFNLTHMIKLAQLYLNKYNVFVYDARSHGSSEGALNSFGFTEQNDLLGAMDFLAGRGFKDVIVHGISQGAATTVYATATNSLPLNLKGIVLEGCYARLDAALAHYSKNASSSVFVKPSLWLASKMNKVDYSKLAVTNYIGKVPAPILLIHEMEDPWMPFGQAQELWSVIKDKPGAESYFIHGDQHYNDAPIVVNRIMSFFGKNF